MTPHLTSVELIDALDGALAPARRAHLDTCDRCHDEATTLHALMGEVRTIDVPEPSPLFWDHFSSRISTEVAHVERPSPARRWFEPAVFAPLVGLAALIVALVAAIPLGKYEPPREQAKAAATAAASDDHGVDAELQWAVLTDWIADLDIDPAAYDTGIATPPGAADSVILRLSYGEQQELLRLLREELRAGG